MLLFYFIFWIALLIESRESREKKNNHKTNHGEFLKQKVSRKCAFVFIFKRIYERKIKLTHNSQKQSHFIQTGKNQINFLSIKRTNSIIGTNSVVRELFQILFCCLNFCSFYFYFCQIFCFLRLMKIFVSWSDSFAYTSFVCFCFR